MEVRSKATINGALVSLFALFATLAITTSGKNDSEAASAQRSGAAIYAQSCARCHGSDGRAQTAKGRAVGATDLTSNDWLPDVARDTRIVTRGKEEMPAFKGRLKPAEIEAVVTYIRRFKR